MQSNDLSRYSYIKDVFIEGNGVYDYINLDKSSIAYHKVLNALQKPFKLILFYGKPGSGKTFLLNKIRLDLAQSANIVFFSQPFFDEYEFILALYKSIFHQKPDSSVTNYESFMRVYRESLGIYDSEVIPDVPIVILLDEAQLYPPLLIEKIRLMADTRLFKILFTVHKTDEEDILAKDYFKTRIWETIELPQSSLSEVKLYIEKKLFFYNFTDVFLLFKDEHFVLIYEFTQGNLRSINNLLYKLFELYEFYESNKASEISMSCLNTKILIMAAIAVGLVDA